MPESPVEKYGPYRDLGYHCRECRWAAGTAVTGIHCGFARQEVCPEQRACAYFMAQGSPDLAA